MRFKYMGKDHTIISNKRFKDQLVKEGEIIESDKDEVYFTKNGFIVVEDEVTEIKEDDQEIEKPKRGRSKSNS